MIGIVYKKSNKKIIVIVPDVLSVSDTDCIGSNASAKGIDASLAGIAIVASTTLIEGDTLGAYTDVRNQLPISDKDRISALETALLAALGLGG